MNCIAANKTKDQSKIFNTTELSILERLMYCLSYIRLLKKDNEALYKVNEALQQKNRRLTIDIKYLKTKR